MSKRKKSPAGTVGKGQPRIKIKVGMFPKEVHDVLFCRHWCKTVMRCVPRFLVPASELVHAPPVRGGNHQFVSRLPLFGRCDCPTKTQVGTKRSTGMTVASL